MNKSNILKNVVCSLIFLTAICVVCLKSTFAAQYEYDKLDRVTKVTYADGSYVEYSYDANGNIKSVKKVDGTPKKEDEVETTKKPEDNSENNTDKEENKDKNDKENNKDENHKEEEDNKNHIEDEKDENHKEEENNKNHIEDVKNKNHKKEGNNKNNKEQSKDKSDKKNNKLGITKNTQLGYEDDFGIVYPKTIEEYLEEDMWFYEVVVKPSPLSKFDWLKYTYTLYFVQQDGVVDDEERKEFKKVLDKFEANKFYRDYIRFKEKLYELIRDAR